MANHHLKIWPEHYAAVKQGRKRAEFRKDDREPRIEEGDGLLLREFIPGDGGGYTGRCLPAWVTHAARNVHVPVGWVMLSITLRRPHGADPVPTNGAGANR